MGFLNSTWFRGERAIEIPINRVRAGATYTYRPVPLDLDMPPFGVLKGRLRPGFMVRVVDLPGFPANTLGHAYIADPETAGYLGLVHCNSLRSITKRTRTEDFPARLDGRTGAPGTSRRGERASRRCPEANDHVGRQQRLMP